MGGDDWSSWVNALLEANLLAPECLNIAYSYIGPMVTQPIYRNGTIGRAKEHLEQTGMKLDALLKERVGGRSYVSVNKAVVTQASSAIPVVPLYVSILFKIMKKAGTHEGCIEQTTRLFNQFLYSGNSDVFVDEQNRIRLDDWEMEEEIQNEIIRLWPTVNSENLFEMTSFSDYQAEFLKLFGFGHQRVDYEKDVDLIHPFDFSLIKTLQVSVHNLKAPLFHVPIHRLLSNLG